MKKELHKAFNENVHRYRNALVYYAKRCEWDGFKLTAGKLFDYVETVEMSELERRFFRISVLILSGLLVVVLFALKIDPASYPGTEGIRTFMTLAVIAGTCFEFFFFLNFRLYMKVKTARYNFRKACFIRYIEEDFRDMRGS